MTRKERLDELLDAKEAVFKTKPRNPDEWAEGVNFFNWHEEWSHVSQNVRDHLKETMRLGNELEYVAPTT